MGTQGTTLRELARAFAKGELGRDEYRRDRSKLVAAILAGEVVVRNIDFPPPIKPPGSDGVDATEPRSRRRRAESSDEPESTTQMTPPRPRPATPPPVSRQPAIPGRLITAVLLVGIAGAATWYITSRPAPGISTPAPAAAPATAAPAAEDPRAEAGRTLISQFLQDRNWSAPRMASFQSEWSALDAEHRAAALGSADAGRLASAIYQRLLEERAVSALGDVEASLARQKALVGFASAIGISDPRLSVPESTAPSEAAATSSNTGSTD